MANISKSDFLEGLQKSGLVEPKRLAAFLKEVADDPPEAIAQKLVREELATKWQAKYLMSGRSRLDIGSYRLLERIKRDEFGDRFLAIHTSLARKVDIQVLPGTLTQDKSSCDRFIQKASLAAKLDHPNLAHVYDIDQEGGRYFMVTEHNAGKTLEEIDPTTLSDTEVAQIVSQAIEGISYAHQHDVIHGCIGPSDLVLGDDVQIKIQHLPLSPLRQQISGDEEPDREHDFSAIARIGSFLLKKAGVSNAARREQLTEAFDHLNTATPDSVAAAADSLAQFIAASKDSGEFDSPLAAISGRREKKIVPAEKPTKPVEIAQPGYVGRLWRDNPIAVIGSALVLTLIVVGGSIYAGMSLMGTLSPPQAKQAETTTPTTQDIEKTPDKSATKNGESNDQSMGDSASRLSSKPVLDQKDIKIPSEKEMAEFLAGIDRGDNSNQAGNKHQRTNPVTLEHPTKEPVPAQAAINNDPVEKFPVNPVNDPGENVVAGQPVSSPLTKTNAGNENAGSVDVVPAAGEPTVANSNASTEPANPETQLTPETESAMALTVPTNPVFTDLTLIRGIAEKTQSVLQKGDVNSLEQMAMMNAAQIQSAIQKGGWRIANKMADYEDWIRQAQEIIKQPPTTENENASTVAIAHNPNATGPFARFPTVTNLGAIENATEIKIADLVIPPATLLGAELICEEGFTKGRTTFELARSSDDKQKWIVGVKKSPNQDATEIATFRKSDDAFYFQWLPAASTDKNASKLAPYLQNCFLKIFVSEDQATYLTLREPIKIPDLRLTPEALMNEIEFLIPAMPEDETIVVEVLPLRITNVETNIPNSRVERNMPARIWLKKQDKTGFLWIQVSGDLRSKLKLQSNLILLFNGSAQPVPSLQSLEELARNVDIAAGRAQMIYEGYSRPANMTKKEFDNQKDELLKIAKAKQDVKGKLIAYGEILPKILNQPISVRVYAKLGNFQTILAVTDPELANSDPDETD